MGAAPAMRGLSWREKREYADSLAADAAVFSAWIEALEAEKASLEA